MNEYIAKMRLKKRIGPRVEFLYDRIRAESAQEAADYMKKKYSGCVVVQISVVVTDWE